MISGRVFAQVSETLDDSDTSLDFSRLLRPHVYTVKSFPDENNTNLFLVTRVQEVMTKTVISVKENSSFHDVVTLMKQHKINRIPVVDEEGRLKGLITRTDLLNYIAEKKD
jgi:CBS domain-containing protein